MKLLVIGLDGVSLPILDTMSEADVTPTLDTLREESAVGSLESQLPPWTPSAWPSLFTGVNPGKHGVFDFFHFEDYDWDIVNRSHIMEYTVWELLSMHGISSVVLNVPVTHPPREFDGVLVPGYVAPEEPKCHPEGIWDELTRELGEYSLYGNTLEDSPADSTLADSLINLTELRGAAFRYLVTEHDPDFGFVQFQTTDTVFHQFPDDDTVIQRVFEAVDREIEAIIESCDADTVLLVSDHGIGPMEGCEFRVNDFLREHGWIDVTTEGGGMPSWKPIARQPNDSLVDRTVVQLAKTGIRMSAKAGLTSQRLATILERLGLKNIVLEIVPSDLIREGAEQIDYQESTAYMRSRTEMGIRINLEGREPSGTVSQSEYEAVRSKLIEQLSTAETPEGDPIFESVSRCEEVFEGPYIDEGPDIVTVPHEFDHFLVANLKGSTIGEPTEPWEHKRDGMLIIGGPEIDQTVSVDGAHLFDIAPTILTYFGLNVSERMDGEPLTVVDKAGQEPYPSFDGEIVASETETVEERLSDLGYLQ